MPPPLPAPLFFRSSQQQSTKLSVTPATRSRSRLSRARWSTVETDAAFGEAVRLSLTNSIYVIGDVIIDSLSVLIQYVIASPWSERPSRREESCHSASRSPGSLAPRSYCSFTNGVFVINILILRLLNTSRSQQLIESLYF